MASNSFGSPATQNDLSLANLANPAYGNNNLVHITGSSVPNDTLTGVSGCPVLGPLRDNGGPTRTHALMSRSVGIDKGNALGTHPLTGNPPQNDQRGLPHPRVSGPFADIGAFEIDQVDIVFNSGFDGCPSG